MLDIELKRLISTECVSTERNVAGANVLATAYRTYACFYESGEKGY